jgi:hypothetical protein
MSLLSMTLPYLTFRRPLRHLGLVLVLCLATSSSFAQSYAHATEQPHKILFVGNSYTYYNSLPQLVKAVAEAQRPGLAVEVKFIGGGGAALETHWEVGEALEEIRSGKWDTVVLQEQSMLGANDPKDPYKPDLFWEYARKFDQEIRQAGADPVYYMTWSRRDKRPDQHFLTDAYLSIANELGSRVAPVGLAWDAVRDSLEMELYVPDGSHPTVLGSYLAALTIARTIFETDFSGVSGNLRGREILRGGALSPGKRQLSNLSEGEVEFLKQGVELGFKDLTARQTLPN